MTYEQFKTDVVAKLELRLGDSGQVYVDSALRYNGVVSDRLTIKHKGSNVSPTIYLEPYFDAYNRGMNLDEVSETIVSIYDKRKGQGFLDTSFLFNDYKSVSSQIIFKLINKEMNMELLKNTPHIEYLDLAIVFYYYMPDLSVADGVGCIMIQNEHAKLWNVTVDDLMNDAMENTPRIMGFKLQGILSTICEYIGDSNLMEMAEVEDRNTPIFVATNEYKSNGAAVILYKDTLRALAAKLKSDLFLIPCSVNEVIIVEAIEGICVDTTKLKEMIYQVNREEIAKQEVLSDNLYFYSRVTGKLCIVD
ncbi:MAG: DUF5688 family protein [Pseudobutyrivibrio sp.]|nr:DUF5688 family protein [Pseudobutyrivibrio sp.]